MGFSRQEYWRGSPFPSSWPRDGAHSCMVRKNTFFREKHMKQIWQNINNWWIWEEGIQTFFLQVLWLFCKLKFLQKAQKYFKSRYSVYLFWSWEQKFFMTPLDWACSEGEGDKPPLSPVYRTQSFHETECWVTESAKLSIWVRINRKQQRQSPEAAELVFRHKPWDLTSLSSSLCRSLRTRSSTSLHLSVSSKRC